MRTKANVDALCDELKKPLTIEQVESIEAAIKAPWIEPIAAGLSNEQKREFVETFAKVGFLPKYKSYGTKYAAPFGYSMFDLKDNEGFSVQIHEEAKVEAFHIFAAHENSFILLGSLDDWEQEGEQFLRAWDRGKPLQSSITHELAAGDVALVSTLNMMHTVVGCILEEFATSSYDVVTRLHDQNKGRDLVLPESVKPVAELLSEAEGLAPKRVLSRTDSGWDVAPLGSSTSIVELDGLSGYHEEIAADGAELNTDEDTIATVVALRGDLMLSFDGFQQLVPVGGTTALPPATAAKLHNASQHEIARAAICKVTKQTALADLRQLVD